MNIFCKKKKKITVVAAIFYGDFLGQGASSLHESQS